MNERTPSFSRSQIDRLGQRLKTGERPTDEDLDLLTRYQASLDPLFRETLRFMAGIYNEEVTLRPFEPTGRTKQVRSIVAKLHSFG